MQVIVHSTAFSKMLEKLVETGTRNRLIHVNRDNKRANALNIINERSDDIFNILKASGKRMRFLATAKDRNSYTEDDVPLLEEIVDETVPFDKARYTDNFLETPNGSTAQYKRRSQSISGSGNTTKSAHIMR